MAQVMASGTSLLLCSWYCPVCRALGVEDQKTVAMYRDPKDLAVKLNYYLKHEDERKKIVAKAAEMAKHKHSINARVMLMSLYMLNDMKAACSGKISPTSADMMNCGDFA
jgi:spore maturation protein CgeB